MSDKITADQIEPQPQAGDPTLDGWYNTLTGMAQAARDKRESDHIDFTRLSYQTCMAAYQSSWLAAKIVDKPADDMTREGWDFEVTDKNDLGDELEDYLEDLDAPCRIEQALKWQRLFGGALVLIGANDGQEDLSKPINEATLQSIDYLNVFDPSEARVVTYQDNPAEECYGEPLMWMIQPTILGQERPRDDLKPGEAKMMQGNLLIPAMQYIHASRVYAFPGTVVSRRFLQQTVNPGMNRGWGDGVLARCIKLIRDFEGAWDGAAFQLREFSQAIYSIQGLAQSLLADKGAVGNSYIQRRMRSIEMSRSMIRAVMLDKDGESFERADSTLAGVADTLREFASVLAAAADIPVSILMGTQGGGLGASGAGSNDIQNWYASIKSRQQKVVKPFLMYLAKLISKCADGPEVPMKPDREGDMQPKGIKVHFRSLYQLTDQELSVMYGQMALADQIYQTMGTISNEDIAQARFSGKPPKVFLVADPTELMAREEMAVEAKGAEHETALATAEAAQSNLQEHGQPTPPPPVKAPPKGG